MYWAVKIRNELVVAHAASNRTFHLLEGQLDGVAAPGKRSWGEYFQEKSRELGMRAALAASAAGLSGFGERQAEGGMIFSLSQDPEYQTRGAERVIDNGGVQGWFAAEYDSFSGVGRSTLYSTAFAYTPSDIALHSHQIVPYLDRNPVFRFGTGSNFDTNRGTVFEINNVITVPGYVNGGSRASIQDLAVAHLAGQLNNFTAPVFATSRPVAGETLTFAGFGVLGTPQAGLIGQDGAIRYGVTRATDSSLDPLGASPALYMLTQTRLTGEIPFANTATRGDTGAILTNSLNEIVASITHGSLQPSTGGAAGLDYTRQDAQAFLRDNQSYVTSVPEPSSILMLAACAAGAGVVRRRRRLSGDRRTQIQDDVITSKLPHRTRSEFAQVVARKVGLGTAMMGAATRSWGQYFQEKGREIGMGAAMADSAVGLSGFGERRADAGIVLAFSDVAPAEARGASATVSQGGNLVAVRRTDSTGFTDVASGVAINRNGIGGVYIAGHFGFDRLQYNPTFTIYTGSDFNTSPGITYTTNVLTLAPGYAGQSTLGSAMDLGFLRLNTEINGAGRIIFPDAPLAPGAQAEIAGFGALGIQDDRIYEQTGKAMAGFSSNFGLAPLLGASSDLTDRIDLDSSVDGAMRASRFDSGAKVFTRNTDNSSTLWGIVGQGSTPIFGTGTQYARTDTDTFRSFDNSNFSTAVPEPSSLLMLASLPFAYLASRWRLRSRG